MLYGINSEIFKNRGGPALNTSLLKQFLFRKMSVSETIEHLNIFFEIVDKLREMEVEIADDLLSFLLHYDVLENFKKICMPSN